MVQPSGDPHEHRAARRRYFLAALPAWLLAGVTAYGLYSWASVPLAAAALVLLLWIGSDIVMYPRLRRYYESEPAFRRMEGECGVALTRLAPEGFVRVHGEIWQVRLAQEEDAVPQGSAVRVCGIEALRLVVELAPAPPSDPEAREAWRNPASRP